MPTKIKKKKKLPYLTTRRLVSAARKGIRKAAKETMELCGYNLIIEKGWLVKKYPDGQIERVSQIPKSKAKLAYD